MRESIIILFFVGIIMSIIGYYENNSKCPKQKVIVKYVDRTLEESQLEPDDVNKKFISMFTDPPLLI